MRELVKERLQIYQKGIQKIGKIVVDSSRTTFGVDEELLKKI
jgi:hypothetical protein